MASISSLLRPALSCTSLSRSASLARTYATASSSSHHKVLIVGGGTAGITVASQLRRSPAFKQLLQGREEKGDVAIIEPSKDHHYQPGWTLVGSGLKPLSKMVRPTSSVIPSSVVHYPLSVSSFDPPNNSVLTSEGISLTYDYLIVAPGLNINFNGISGLPAALQDPSSGVSSIYSGHSAEQTWENIQKFDGGKAIFTQPAGVVKCAGAPQKIMWMALSQWKKDGKREKTDITFATGAPAMFAVPKYSKALEALRVERGVDGLFSHNLTSIDASARVAIFSSPSGPITRPYDLLHVVPPQAAHAFVANSPLAEKGTGWVEVDKSTTQHVRYKNVFSIGDGSSLPNSKTAAAVSSQAPVLVDNLLSQMRGTELTSVYEGYASCPLLTGHNELMLCEFKYGGVPAETFAKYIGSQDVPRRAFYHLKKDVFPTVYWNYFLGGSWYGSSGFIRPDSVPKPNASAQAQPAQK